MTGIINHSNKMDDIKKKDENRYKYRRKQIKKGLTNPTRQFSTTRNRIKVEALKRGAEKRIPKDASGMPNETLTVLLEDKVQLGKIFRKDNLESVQNDLRARDIPFDPHPTKGTSYSQLKSLLREDERRRDPAGNPKFFRPITDWNNFKWLPIHFS